MTSIAEETDGNAAANSQQETVQIDPSQSQIREDNGDGLLGERVILLQSRGNSITESGQFEVGEGEILTLHVISSVSGGSVDFFLTSPDFQQYKYTFTHNDALAIEMSVGTWAYNCTGFYTSGSITIQGYLGDGDPVLRPEPPRVDISQAEDTIIFIDSRGQGGISQSDSFVAEDGQTLRLEITSDIQGGSVDFFLFSPQGEEQRFSFAQPMTSEIPLTAGTWAYNCSGQFESGNFQMIGILEQQSSAA